MLWKKSITFIHRQVPFVVVRRFSRVSPPPPSCGKEELVVRVSNKNVAYLGRPKAGPKPRQLMSLPPFPPHPLPGKNSSCNSRVTAISWIKYYFQDIPDTVIQTHFAKGLVQLECHHANESSMERQGHTIPMKKVQLECHHANESSMERQGHTIPMKKIKHNEVMKVGSRVLVPVSIAESRISKRFDCIPSGTLYPNADEIKYLQRLVMYKDPALLVLNKPPKLPVKGNLPIHNSMDALAAAALSYDYDEGPKLVHRLDRDISGIILMGRTKESISHLDWLFSDLNKARSSKVWNGAFEATFQRYWALVIGAPKEKEGIICAPLSKVLLDDGKTERVILAYGSGLESSQEAVTEYRVLGPTINGCSWIELRPLTSRKHQIRVHCAEALGTPIVGDYKYGWFVHKRWKEMPKVDIEPISGEPYKMRRPKSLDVQKGSVLSKVPLLHLHCREVVLPNIAKFLADISNVSEGAKTNPTQKLKPDLLRFVAKMPSHMKISWNLMSSYLV